MLIALNSAHKQLNSVCTPVATNGIARKRNAAPRVELRNVNETLNYNNGLVTCTMGQETYRQGISIKLVRLDKINTIIRLTRQPCKRKNKIKQKKQYYAKYLKNVS